jgi:hypothetical protein
MLCSRGTLKTWFEKSSASPILCLSRCRVGIILGRNNEEDIAWQPRKLKEERPGNSPSWFPHHVRLYKRLNPDKLSEIWRFWLSLVAFLLCCICICSCSCSEARHKQAHLVPGNAKAGLDTNYSCVTYSIHVSTILAKEHGLVSDLVSWTTTLL